LVIDDEMRDGIAAECSLGHLRMLARKSGMLSLAADGFQKVKEGITTVEEIFHVADDTRADTAAVKQPVEAGAAS
jgi:type IV pilus assembly protein PilB